MKDKVQEQALEAVRLSRPEDYDGHTGFDRMTPSQRLAWLDEATMFVFNQGAATKKKTGQPNRGRDDRLGRPIDSFTARGSKIAIGRWRPSPLPGFTPQPPNTPSPENAGQTLGLFGWPADASHQNWSNLPS